MNRQKFRGSTTAALPPFSGRAARVGYFFDLALDFFVDLAAFDFAGVEEQPELLQPQDDFFMAMVTFSKCGSGLPGSLVGTRRPVPGIVPSPRGAAMQFWIKN